MKFSFLTSFFIVWFGVIQAQTYCSRTAVNDCSQANRRMIQTFSISKNGDGIFKYSSDCDGMGYADRTDKNIDLIVGETYQASVFSLGGIDLAGLWIDWNADGDFDDADETITMAGGLGASTGTFTVPATAVVGTQTRLRALNDYFQDVMPCGSSDYGEAEDYGVTIVAGTEVSTDYCEITGPSCDRHITNVFMVDELLGSPINNTSGCSPTGYTHFTNIPEGVLALGSSYTTEIVTNMFNQSDDVKVFIDWNQDKDFEDVGESISIPGNGGEYLGSINVPVTALTGSTRMRVVFSFNLDAAIAPSAPCGNIQRGEVEDYNIYVDNILFPPPPECVTINEPVNQDVGVCTSGETLSWIPSNLGTAATGFKVSLGTDNPPTDVYDKVDVAADTFMVIQDQLLPGTVYYWSVSPYNDNGETAPCEIWEFTTNSNLNPIVDILSNTDSVSTCLSEDLLLATDITEGSIATDYIYTWEGADVTTVLNSETIGEPTFNSSQELTSYKLNLVATDTNNCSGTDTIIVYVKASPDAGVVSPLQQLVCEGEIAEVEINGSTGVIEWESSTDNVNFNFTGQSTTLFSQSFTGGPNHYLRAVLNLDGCRDTSEVATVVNNPIPSPPTIDAVNNDFTFCEGDFVTLYTSSYSDGLLWDYNSETNDTITVGESRSVMVTYTDPSTGCEANSLPVNVIQDVMPAPPVINSSTGSFSFCEGGSVQLESTPYTTDLLWSDGITTSANITVNQGGDFNVSYTDPATGCNSTSSIVTVVENANPSKPQITASAFEFCDGESVTASTTNYNNNLVWSDAQNTASDELEVSETSSLTVTYTDPSTGCFATSDEVNFTKNDLPAAPVLSATEIAFCEGESTTISSTNYTNGLSWSTGETSSSIEVDQTASISAVYTDPTTGCSQGSTDLEIEVYPIPNPPTVSIINGNTLHAEGNGTITWYNESNQAVSSGFNDFLPSVSGNYYAIVTSDKGCDSEPSEVQFVTVGIFEHSAVKRYDVHPNPSHGRVFVNGLEGENIQVEVVNQMGQVVHHQTINQGQNELLLNVDHGAYTLRFTSNGIQSYSKLIVE